MVLAQPDSSGPDTRTAGGVLLPLFGGAYIVVGGQVRRHLSTTAYTAIRYSACAAALLAVCLLAGLPPAGSAAADLARIVAVMVFAKLFGHSLFSLVLRSASATLFTVPLAIVLAADAPARGVRRCCFCSRARPW
jgi:hypothetical protein